MKAPTTSSGASRSAANCTGVVVDVPVDDGALTFEVTRLWRLPGYDEALQHNDSCAFLRSSAGWECFWLSEHASRAHILKHSYLEGPLCFKDPSDMPPDGADLQYAQVNGGVIAFVFCLPFTLVFCSEALDAALGLCASRQDASEPAAGARYAGAGAGDGLIGRLSQAALEGSSAKDKKFRLRLFALRIIWPLVGVVVVVALLTTTVFPAFDDSRMADCKVLSSAPCTDASPGNTSNGCCVVVEMPLTAAQEGQSVSGARAALGAAPVPGDKFNPVIDIERDSYTGRCGPPSQEALEENATCYYSASELQDSLQMYGLLLDADPSMVFCPDRETSDVKLTVPLFPERPSSQFTGALYRIVYGLFLSTLVTFATCAPCSALACRVAGMRRAMRRRAAQVAAAQRGNIAHDDTSLRQSCISCVFCCCDAWCTQNSLEGLGAGVSRIDDREAIYHSGHSWGGQSGEIGLSDSTFSGQRDVSAGDVGEFEVGSSLRDMDIGPRVADRVADPFGSGKRRSTHGRSGGGRKGSSRRGLRR